MENCFLLSCFSTKDEETVEATACSTKETNPKYVYREDLNKSSSSFNKESSPAAPAPAPARKEEHSRKQVIGSPGGVSRVKVLLTKKEAAVLLSKCRVEGGLLKLNLTDHQLQRIKGTTCISATTTTTTKSVIFPTSPDRSSWNPALESISEEL